MIKVMGQMNSVKEKIVKIREKAEEAKVKIQLARAA